MKEFRLWLSKLFDLERIKSHSIWRILGNSIMLPIAIAVIACIFIPLALIYLIAYIPVHLISGDELEIKHKGKVIGFVKRLRYYRVKEG